MPTTRPRLGAPVAPPLIAVTTSEMRSAALDAPMAEGDPPRREMALGLRYLEAVERAGALPVVLAPVAAPFIDALLDRVDGVCLSGGPDLHPSAYGEDAHAALGPTEPRLDAFELQLVRAADRRALPILGICRGAQVLNVARGGALHQHLPDEPGTTIAHRQTGDASVATHRVEVAPHMLVRELVGEAPEVNSLHHQAVAELGAGLVATAWAPDGTVEAVEAVDREFAVGVQWHAEYLVDRPEQAAIFEGFVGACESYRSPNIRAATG